MKLLHNKIVRQICGWAREISASRGGLNVLKRNRMMRFGWFGLTILLGLVTAECAIADFSVCTWLLKDAREVTEQNQLKGSSLDLVNVWIRALNRMEENPTGTTLEWARALEVREFREDFVSILTQLKNRRAVSPTLSPAVRNLTEESLRELEARIETALAIGFLTYADLVDFGMHFVLFSDGALPRRAEKILIGEGRSSTTEEIRTYTRELFQSYMDDFLEDFPYFLQIPTFRPLDLDTFSHLGGLSVGYAGLSVEHMHVDGEDMTPIRFFFHDQFHNARKKKQIFRTLFGREDVALSGIHGTELSNFVKSSFEKNKLFPRYESFIKPFPVREQTIARALYFDFDHESASYEIELYEVWRYLQMYKMEYRGGPAKKLRHFVERLNDQGDIAPSIRSLGAVSETEVLDVVNHLSQTIEAQLKNPSTEKAFHWIVDFLENLKIPFEVSGGLAARVHGTTRPIADIDLNLSESHFEEILPLIEKYVVSGPSRYHDASWDLDLITLEYEGQTIDLAGIENTQIYDRGRRIWRPLKTDFSKSDQKTIFGRSVHVTPKPALLEYKKALRRNSDRYDIWELGL